MDKQELKKFIIYDDRLNLLCELSASELSANQQISGLLKKCIFFLQVGDTFYYRVLPRL